MNIVMHIIPLLICLFLCISSLSAEYRIDTLPVRGKVADPLESFAAGEGAEFFDLLQLREHHRLEFHTLFFAFKSSPHVALLIKPLVVPGFDRFMYGDDEYLEKSPFERLGEVLSLLLTLLSPGALAAAYMHSFYDTNPYVSSFLMATFFLSDVQFWFHLYVFVRVPKSRSVVLENLALRNVLSIFGTVLYRYIFFPIIPRALEDLFFIAFVCLAPFISLYRVYEGFDLAGIAVSILHNSERAAVEARLRAKVEEALTTLREEDFFMKADPLDTYDVNATIKSGNFGEVLRVRNKREKTDAALKMFFNRTATAEVTAGAAPKPGAATKIIQLFTHPSAIQTRIGNMRATLNEWLGKKTKVTAQHECRALLIVRRLGEMSSSSNLGDEGTGQPQIDREWINSISSMRFCRILGAYEHSSNSSSSSAGASAVDPKYSIAMRLEDADWKERVTQLPLAGRLAFFTRFIEAMSLLHSVGIQHRDLKEGNLAMRPTSAATNDDPVPVILDFGAALLPDSKKDRFVGVGTPGYFPPESIRLMLKKKKASSSRFNDVFSLLQYLLCMGPLGIDSSDLDWLSSGGMGFPADVFAAAVIGITIFSGVSHPAMHYYLRNFGDGRDKPSQAYTMHCEELALQSWTQASARELALIAASMDDDVNRTPPRIIDLLTSMLHPRPEERLTMSQVLHELVSISHDE